MQSVLLSDSEIVLWIICRCLFTKSKLSLSNLLNNIIKLIMIVTMTKNNRLHAYYVMPKFAVSFPSTMIECLHYMTFVRSAYIMYTIQYVHKTQYNIMLLLMLFRYK